MVDVGGVGEAWLQRRIAFGDNDDVDMMVMVIKWWMIVIMVILC